MSPSGSIRGLVPRRPHTCCAPASSLLTTAPPPLPTRHLRQTPRQTLQPTVLLGQVRHATFIPRPRRPYQFTQLIQLSDGSTFTVRTTSPAPVHKSVQDTRNHILWQPTERSLQNVEHDEAGKLAAFRERFGRGFDLRRTEAEIEADRERRRVREVEEEVARRQRAAALAKDEGIDLDAALLRIAQEEQDEGRVENKSDDARGAALDEGGIAQVGVDEDDGFGDLQGAQGEGEGEEDEGIDALSDLISGYAQLVEKPKKAEKAAPPPPPPVEEAKGKGKGKGGKK